MNWKPMNRKNMNRNPWRAALLAAALCSAANLASAQNLQPIDPLQRPKSGAGSSSFSFSGEYSPNVAGNAISLGAGLGLTASYNVTDQLSVTASTGVSASRTESVNEQGVTAVTGAGRWNGLSVGAQYTFGGRFAPSLGLDVGLPLTGNGWAVTGSASASFLRDPLILDATVAASYYSKSEPSISVGTGVGFVVNDAVTLRGDAVQSLTFATLTLPSTTLGFGGVYKFNEQSSVQTRTTLDIVGGRSSAGVSLSYVYRP